MLLHSPSTGRGTGRRRWCYLLPQLRVPLACGYHPPSRLQQQERCHPQQGEAPIHQLHRPQGQPSCQFGQMRPSRQLWRQRPQFGHQWFQLPLLCVRRRPRRLPNPDGFSFQSHCVKSKWLAKVRNRSDGVTYILPVPLCLSYSRPCPPRAPPRPPLPLPLPLPRPSPSTSRVIR